MIRLYFSKCSTRLSDVAFSQYLNLLPAELGSSIKRLRKWEDQQAKLYGKLLLMKAMEDAGAEIDLAELKYTEFRRPYFEHAPDFNISHAGSYAVCALSLKGRIGVDIEEVKDINIEGFKEEFSGEEWNFILNADNRTSCFYNYWTAKEAVIKADGRGLHLPLSEINVKDNKAMVGKHWWYVKQIFLDDRYMVQIATEKLTDTKIDVIEVNFQLT